MKSWKKINTKKVFEGFRFLVFEDNIIRPDGSPGKYIHLKQKPGVVVVPFDGKKIYLVNQYRYPLHRRCWELPAGGAESNNYLLEAKKELLEETGINAKKWKYLGQYAPSSGTSNRLGKIFLAEKLKFGHARLEPGERDMYMKAFTLKQVDRMIKRNIIVDGWTIVSLYKFKSFFNL